MNRDVARFSEQIKNCYGGGDARFLYALNTSTVLLNISFSLSGSSPKYCSFEREREREREGERFMCVCVCVCVRARARAFVFLCSKTRRPKV